MEGKTIAHLTCLMVMLISVASQDAASKEAIITKEAGDGVKITCEKGIWLKDDVLYRNASELELQYSDDNSGVYMCQKDDRNHNILVKFRTCDNCIALDTGTVVGIIVGEVVATLLIGWAVYLLASQPQGKVFNQANKASDRQNLIQNQQNDSTYQQLSHGNSSEYSHLEPRRGGSTDHARSRPPAGLEQPLRSAHGG